MITDEQELTLVGMSALHAGHIRLVIECNAAKTNGEKCLREAVIKGFRDALILMTGRSLGSLIIEADQYYIEQGIDRPMCGGVFLEGADGLRMWHDVSGS